MKTDLDGLFREAERLRPPAELWWRIAERSPLARGVQGMRSLEWLEVRYLKAAGVVLAAGLFTLAAFGFLRKPSEEPVREASAETALTAPAGTDTDLIDPELLGWQAGLGNIDLVADEAEEAL